MYAFVKYSFVILATYSSTFVSAVSAGINNTNTLQNLCRPYIQYPCPSDSITAYLFDKSTSRAYLICLPLFFHSRIVDFPEKVAALWNKKR